MLWYIWGFFSTSQDDALSGMSSENSLNASNTLHCSKLLNEICYHFHVMKFIKPLSMLCSEHYICTLRFSKLIDWLFDLKNVFLYDVALKTYKQFFSLQKSFILSEMKKNLGKELKLLFACATL